MDRCRADRRRLPAAARAAGLALAALAPLALGACPSPREQAPPAGLGKLVLAGPVKAVHASADGAWLAALQGCRDAKQRVLPPGTASCDLVLVPAAGGAPRALGEGVSTLPGQVRWAPEGALLAAMTGYDYATGLGTLVTVDGKGRTGSAEGAGFFAFPPGHPPESVWVVANGVVGILDPAGGLGWLPVKDAASFEIGPGEAGALVRQPAQAGGGLVLVAGGAPRKIAERTAEYAFDGTGGYAFTVQGRDGAELRLARSAAAAPVAAGKQVRSFAFAPAGGGALAWVGEVAPGKQGDLRVREPDGKETVLAREVGEFRWAARSPRLAWLEKYDARVRSGTVGAGGPGLAPRSFVPNVSDFALSPDGAHLAFLQHTTRGGYSVDLSLVALDAETPAPALVAPGVFGFAFSPDGRWLYYRTRCTRNAEACDLERVPAGGLAPGGKPEPIAQAAKSFEFDPRNPGRLLVTWQRMDRDALDLAVWAGGKTTRVDTYVVPGTARFLGPDSRRVVYAVLQEKRAGVYVAEVP